jgi:hypothetical protein
VKDEAAITQQKKMQYEKDTKKKNLLLIEMPMMMNLVMMRMKVRMLKMVMTRGQKKGIMLSKELL